MAAVLTTKCRELVKTAAIHNSIGPSLRVILYRGALTTYLTCIFPGRALNGHLKASFEERRFTNGGSFDHV